MPHLLSETIFTMIFDNYLVLYKNKSINNFNPSKVTMFDINSYSSDAFSVKQAVMKYFLQLIYQIKVPIQENGNDLPIPNSRTELKSIEINGTNNPYCKK